MSRVNDVKVSKNFNLGEFECNDGSNLVILDGELVEKLQQLRDEVGVPIHLDCGYRTLAHNKAVGGSPKSQHMLGKAADIKIHGYTPEQVAKLAIKIGFKGIGIYNTFTHVDVRGHLVNTIGRSYDTWDFRK